IASRMESGSYRGWDLWLENGRLATHLVHQWPDNAVKVSARNPLKPGQWHHVFVTYDGKSQAGGVKLYLDGVAQDTLPDRNKLNGSIRSTEPLRVGQRKNASRLDDVVVQDLRIYSRVLPARE